MGFLIFWIALALLCANIGTSRKYGYWNAFWVCLIFSPLIGSVIVLCSPKKKFVYNCTNCDHQGEEKFYYCPRCQKDKDGYTVEDNKLRFAKDRI